MLEKMTGAPWPILAADVRGLETLAALNEANTEVFIEAERRWRLRQIFLSASLFESARTYFVALDPASQIIGSVTLQDTDMAGRAATLGQICVDPLHRRQGLATALLQQVFAYETARHWDSPNGALVISPFTEDGRNAVLPTLRRLERDHALRVEYPG